MSGIVWVDTETSSLRPDRRAWEIALIVRRGDGDHEYSWFVDLTDLDLGNADLASLRFGDFYSRHPQMASIAMRVVGERDALVAVEELTRGAVLHGSNPGFDAEVLGARMRANGICPSWHYHPEDVPTLARGWLLGRGTAVPYRADGTVKSDDVSRACGIDPDGYDRGQAAAAERALADRLAEVRAAPPPTPEPEAPADAGFVARLRTGLDALARLEHPTHDDIDALREAAYGRDPYAEREQKTA